MEKMEYYYFTIPRSPKIQRDWDSITNCIADLNGSCKYLYMDKPFYDLEKPNRVMLRFLYLVKADRKDTPLQEDISELKDIFGCKIELLPIKQHTAPKEVLDALPIAKNLMSAYSGGYIRGNAEFRLILETSKEQLSRTKKMTGFSSFKEAFRRINSLSDRMIELGKRGNYNVVLVNDCGANEFVFSDMLYSLLVSKGIIKDQRIVRGDLDDAVCTSSNTSLFYFIVETWDFGNHDGFRWGMPQEESFRLLSRRKNVYITTMDRAQYEKAQEFDYFKAFFPHTVEIKDLKEEEKVELLKCAAKEYGFTFDAKSFRNSDILKLPYPTLQTQLYSVIQNQLADADNTEFVMHASDFDPLAKKSDKNSNALEELDALIGLDSVKKCVREIVALLKNRGRSALPCLHMVFRGNPGTGKTTVARLIGKLFGEIGVIKDGERFIETDRDGLVSQYLGGTAAKTASVVKDALGGVLFIDEAYALASNVSYDYGHEAINTLVKRLEDSRKDFVCIMAGYTNEMNQMLSSNPGLRDRIQFYIDFPDYSAEELVQIYCKYAESEAYQLGTDAKVTLRQMAEQIIRNKDENFSNARLIRKVFERTRMKQAMRTSDNMISAEDIQAVFAESDMRALLDSVQVQRRIGFAG